MIKCEFCGFEFDVRDCKSGCSGCPMSGSCGKIKCPNCNYEMYPEPELRMLKTLVKWGRNLWGK